MDPFFITFFPLVALLFVLTDWQRLKKRSKGIKTAYAAIMALSFGLFVLRVAGVEVPLPPRFFIQYVTPAVESMLGIK